MATYERLDYGSPDGSQWGGSSTDKLAFFGGTPVVQRPYSSAVHATSALATSTDFGATQLAAVQELQKTLIGLGIWATV
jgi:hypothetical protein